MNTKLKIALVLILIGTTAFVVHKQGLPQPQTQTATNTSQSQPQADQSKVLVVSTNPNPLDGTTILPTQKIQITFSKPAQNEAELKIKTDPLVDLQINLSSDKKTVSIIPKRPFELGVTYTLFVDVDAKFENGAKLDSGPIYHFKILNYSGV